MLQDMAVGRLENEYRNIPAGAEDAILCFHEGRVLICRGADDTLELPTLSTMVMGETPAAPRYLFRMRERNFFLWTDAAPASPAVGFAYEPVRQLRQLKSKEICFAVMTGFHYLVRLNVCLCIIDAVHLVSVWMVTDRATAHRIC